MGGVSGPRTPLTLEGYPRPEGASSARGVNRSPYTGAGGVQPALHKSAAVPDGLTIRPITIRASVLPSVGRPATVAGAATNNADMQNATR